MSLRLSTQLKAAQWRNIMFAFLTLNCLFHDCHISSQSKKEALVLHSYRTEINIQLATFCLLMVLQHSYVTGTHKNSNTLLQSDRRATFLHCSRPSVLRKGKSESQQVALLSTYVKVWQRDPLKNGKVVFAGDYLCRQAQGASWSPLPQAVSSAGSWTDSPRHTGYRDTHHSHTFQEDPTL